MDISYENLQLLQFLVISFLGVIGWVYIRCRGLLLVQCPLFLVVIGYGYACVASNQLRYITNDLTVLSRISSTEYTSSTIWWCSSEIIFTILYLVTTCGLRQKTNHVSAPPDIDRKLLRITFPWYILLGIILVLCIFFNPFRGRDYGVISATDATELSTGGLLVSGILVFILSAITIPLLINKSIVGVFFLIVSIWHLSETGSKAIAVVYFVIVSAELWRVGGKLWTKKGHFRYSISNVSLLILSVILLISICGVLLTRSVSKRFNDQEIDVAAAGAASVGRFTQQEMACMIFTQNDWRAAFSGKYVADIILSFVPGFIWKNKPLNPAYAINDLMGRGFTAASPSIFGAIYLGCNGTGYWFLLALSGICLGIFDRYISAYKGVSMSNHIFWYAFYSCAMLYEGNFVIWGIQVFFLITWGAILRHYINSEQSMGFHLMVK